MCEFKHGTEKVGTQDDIQEKEDSEQPKLEQKKRHGDCQHQSGNINQR